MPCFMLIQFYERREPCITQNKMSEIWNVHLNQTIEVTDVVECEECKSLYATNPPEHAHK